MTGSPWNPSKTMCIISRMHWRQPEYEVLIITPKELTWDRKIGNFIPLTLLYVHFDHLTHILYALRTLSKNTLEYYFTYEFIHSLKIQEQIPLR